MLNKRRSQLLLVRVKPVGKIRLVIPIPFFLLDIYARALADLLLLGQLVLPFGLQSLQRHIEKHTWGKEIKISLVGDMIGELVLELRKIGRWRMVEVKTHDIEVYIDLY